MLYQKATIENGSMKILETKVIDQSKLTGECWLIQMDGPKACETCEAKDKPNECGGMALRGYTQKPLKFTWLTGDVNWKSYGGKWISQVLNNGDFDYWMVIEFINMEDACGSDATSKYAVEVEVVSPSQVGAEELKRAFDSYGVEEGQEISDEMRVEVLVGYGCSATIFSEQGNNANKLLRAARMAARQDFKASMDRFQNKVGHTGWDRLRGDLSWETAEKNRKAYEAAHS